VYAPEADDLLDEAEATVEAALIKALSNGISDIDSLEREVRKAAGKFVSDRTKRRPMIVPVVMTT
jgi:ribonuclease J